ncbi:MAG TPA: hypothetical protein VIM65_13005 [Cyclobacteriaceae bacterium]
MRTSCPPIHQLSSVPAYSYLGGLIEPCVAIHTTWKQHWDAVINLLPKIEQQLAPFNPRPHWAKVIYVEAFRSSIAH